MERERRHLFFFFLSSNYSMGDIIMFQIAVEKEVGKLAKSSLITVKPYFAASCSHDDAVPLPVGSSLLDLPQQCVVDDICSHSEHY